jgi:SpoVK/Ycf46/Vps4 family AAA+-type ATPase
LSVLIELNIEYNKNFSKAVIALAREDYLTARTFLEKAAKALNEIAVRRTGENKDYTLDWVFDIVKEIGDIDRKINIDRSKDKFNKMLAEKRANQPDKRANPPREDIKTAQGETEQIESRYALKEVPKTTFDDIAGLEEVKEAVMYKVIYPRQNPELYDTFKKRSGGGILLYGLPGTGKTLIAEAIAHETNATFFPIKCSDIGSKWFGETEQNIRSIFEEARQAENAVIFFDEIEAYASNRRENSAMERSIPEFLAQMQGIGASEERNRILIIGATNKPWRLDGAFLRPGRFDEKIYVPLPCEKARKQIMQLRLDGVPSENINLEDFAYRTAGYNGADIDYLCEKAKEFAIKRVIANQSAEKLLTLEDFEKAFSLIKSSVLDVDRIEMEKWEKEYVA